MGVIMARRRTAGTAWVSHNDVGRRERQQRRPGIVQSSIYLPIDMHNALREAAFKERCKIHDIMLEGIRLALNKRQQKVR
jgi:hypothetical protein